MSETQHLRYTPGHTYCFARIVSRNKLSGSTVRSGWFDPKHFEFIAVETVLLRCETHEVVAWEFDPKDEKKHDGFIFREVGEAGDGRTFNNQYPVASFGQTSDLANYQVRLANLADNLKGVDARDGGAGAEAFSAITSSYQDAFQILGNLAQATLKGSLSHLDAHWTADEAEQFNNVFDVLKTEVETTIGRSIGFRDAIITFTNGKPPETLPGHLEAYILHEDKAA